VREGKMEIKYILELEIPDDVMKTLAAAQLKLDDLLQTKIETALGPVLKGKGAVIIYKAEEGKKKIDLYKVCPVCNHPWPHHFTQVALSTAPMSDGTVGAKQVLADPTPVKCSAKDCECMEALT
jgi:hypothetical protein